MSVWSNTLGIACLIVLAQLRPAAADPVGGTSLHTGDLVTVVFDPSYSMHSTRVLTMIIDIDEHGVISISGNRDISYNHFLQKTSLTGTLRAEDVNVAHQIPANKVNKLKMTIVETNAPQSPDEQ